MAQLTAWTVTQESSGSSTTEVGCINPGSLLEIAEDLGYSVDEWYGKANSFTLGTGTTPGRCHLLLRKQDLDLFDLNKFLKVKAYCGSDVCTFDKLIPTRCVAIYANSNEPSASVAYLLTLADRRQILRMKAIDDLFNVRTPEPTGTSGAGLYYDASLSSGTTVWTWQTLLTRIWDQYIALGLSAPYAPNASPTLPYTPDGTPENFRFHGVSALEAYATVLDKIQCVLVYDIFTDTFSLQRRATPQSNDLSAITTLEQAGKALATQAPKHCKAALIPEKIRVYFRAIEKFTGSGMDSNNGGGGGEYASSDGPYWTAPAVYKDVSTSVTGAIAGTKVCVWDDLPAIMPNGFRASQASAADNASDLTARANAIAAEYAGAFNTNGEYLRKLFTSYANTVKPGSEIREIVWSDYGDEDIGPTTEYRRYPDEPSRSFDLDRFFSRETIGPPDIARSLLVRPRETQIVEITGLQSDAANGLYPGRILRTDFVTSPGSTAIPYTTENDCWVLNIDLAAQAFGASVAFLSTLLSSGERFIGRLIGWKTISSDTRPVYAVTGMPHELRGKVKTSAISPGGSGTMTIWRYNGSSEVTTSVDITVYDFMLKAATTIAVGKWLVVRWFPDSQRWYIVEAECP